MEVENSVRKPHIFSFHRDFPPGCGILNSSSSLSENSAVKSVHKYIRDFPPGCGPNNAKNNNKQKLTINRNPEKIVKKLKVESGKISGSSSGSTDWKHTDANTVNTANTVGLCGERGEKGEKDQNFKGKEKEERERSRVVRILKLFRDRCVEVSRSGEHVKRVDIFVYGELKNGGYLGNCGTMMVGHVPGVEIGDEFNFRAELLIVGLHRLLQGGIDSMKYGGGGKKIATCIVANEGHMDNMSDPNVLKYVGEGGTLQKNGVAPDQEIKGGNEALWNSMKEKMPVRVVRGLRFGAKVLYVYDGLYVVKDCIRKKGPAGNLIFEFVMSRCPGQPPVNWTQHRLAR